MGAEAPLACTRCKEKKLRCSKRQPCDRCVTANAACITAERKPRVSRKVGHQDIISSLNQRVESIEGALRKPSSPDTRLQQVHHPTITYEVAPVKDLVGTRHDDSAERAGSGTTDSAEQATFTSSGEGWLRRQLLAAKAFSISHLDEQGHMTNDSPVSQAITALDGALTEMGGLGNVFHSDDLEAGLTREEAKAAVRAGLVSLQGEFFTSFLDAEFMSSLSNIISSPHIHIEPAVRLVYYNLLFHGFLVGESKTQTIARSLYSHCLGAMKQWQETATGTMMDLVASCLTSWTAIHSFDFKLAWKLHSQACRIAMHLGLHRLDVSAGPSQTKQEEELRNRQRGGFWQLVLVDLFFRLCYDKPSCISAEASPVAVKIASPGDLSSQRPVAGLYSTQIIWTRLTFIGKTFFESYDRVTANEVQKSAEAFQRKMDNLCDEIELIITDWRLAALMEAESENPLQSWLYADVLIGSLTALLNIDKLRQDPGDTKISERSLRAARTVLDTIYKSDAVVGANQQQGGVRTYGLAFYPFRAFFALYYHILNSDTAEEYSDDILRLERIGIILSKAAASRYEYIPIAKAIKSLNQVAKHVQQIRIMTPAKQWDVIYPPQTMSAQDQLAEGWDQQQEIPQGVFADWMLQFDEKQFPAVVGFQEAAAQPGFEPTAYMQNLENRFAGELWNYGWWDAGVESLVS